MPSKTSLTSMAPNSAPLSCVSSSKEILRMMSRKSPSRFLASSKIIKMRTSKRISLTVRSKNSLRASDLTKEMRPNQEAAKFLNKTVEVILKVERTQTLSTEWSKNRKDPMKIFHTAAINSSSPLSLSRPISSRLSRRSQR